MTTQASPIAPIEEVENLDIALADGCRLAARLFLPATARRRPVPAILEYIPYRKRDFMRRRDESLHRWFAQHGYAAVRVDMRGSGESDGILDDEYLELEQSDALEVIDWIARQPWCSGRVGMMGKSWGAYNALQVAARRPPALKAVIAVMGTDDRYRECIHYSGGCLLNDNFWWGCIMQVFNARPPDPLIVGERWRATWLERLEAERFWPALWLEHQTLDDYWKHGSVCFDYGAIEVPVWFWGGWADLYRDSPLRLAAHLKVPRRVTMGPWGHLYPHEALPAPAVGFLQAALGWWDQWLKGEERGVMREPALQFYMMDGVEPRPFHAARAGRWVSEPAWPSPQIATRELTLNATGTSLGALDPVAGAATPLRIASPQTTGLAAGDWGSFAVPGDLPGDQSRDASGSLEFDSAPFESPLEILGNSALILELAADQPVALLAARLIDVAPDGRASSIARGFLNLTHRKSDEQPAPLEPGQWQQVRVSLTGTGYVLAHGHRLRVALSSAYWPIVWPAPRPVTLTLMAGRSRLELPVRTGESRQTLSAPYAAPESGAAGAVTPLRKGRVERTVTIDELTGEVMHRLFIDGGVFGDVGKFRLDDIGMELAHVMERTYRIRPEDPNSAIARMRQTYEMGREEWQIRIETFAEMTSTEHTFELSAWLEALEGGHLVKRRDWRASIPRRLV